MLLAWMSFAPAARPNMNLPVLVNLRVFRRRIGSNPKDYSTVALIAGAAAPRPTPVRDLRQSTNVSTHNAYSPTYTPNDLLRKQLAALSIDRKLEEEKLARTCGHGVGHKKQAARREQDLGCDVGRAW